MFTLGFSSLTTFLGVNTAPFAKTVTYPSATQAGRVLRVKDISGTTATYKPLILSTTQGQLIDGQVSSLLFSTGKNAFTAITMVADGASNWTIKNAYTDMLIRAAPQPTDVSGLHLWFDVNIIQGNTGDNIFSFGNRLSTMSGGKNHKEVFTGNGPLLQVSSLNGKNTLLFNQTGYYMNLSPDRYYDSFTFFAVSRLTNVNNARIWQGKQGNIYYGYQGGLKNVLYMDNQVIGARSNANITTVNSNWDLLTVTRDSQGSAELFNFAVSQGRGPGYMGFQGLSINNGFTGENSTAEIAEWLVYNKKLSLAEQQRVEGYLAQKYGFTNNLPVTHPFTTKFISTLGAPSTLADITSLRLWFDASQKTGYNGQPISSLSNLVGTGEVFGSNSSDQNTWPTLLTNQLNGYPILNFTTVPQRLYLQQARKYPVFTMFSVTRMTPFGNQQRRILQGVTWTTWYGHGCNFYGSWVKNHYATDNNIEVTGTGNDFNWDIYTFFRNSNSVAGISAFGSNINKGYSQVGFESIAINTGYDTTNTSACQFAEVLVYDRELAADECSRVESYLCYKYGQANKLYIPTPAAKNIYLQTPQPIISTISSISTISNLKIWFDATQIPIYTHPYKFTKQNTILPSNISSLDCWFDASGASNFLLTNSSIVSWYDKGSNARDLVQLTVSSQAIYNSVSNLVNFNGNQQYLYFTTTPNITYRGFSIFFVEQRQTTSATYILGGSNTGSYTNLYAGYVGSYNYNVNFYNTAGFSPNTDVPYNYRYSSNEPYRIWCIHYTTPTSNLSLYVNGIFIRSQPNIPVLTSWLGGSLGNYNCNYFVGNIKELIIYSNALGDIDRQNVEGYLASKWGLQANLVNFTSVSTMMNLTQMGLNMVSSNTGDQYWMPKLSYNAINGMNVLHFNCNNSMYQQSNIIYPTEFTMFTFSRYTYSNGLSNSRSIFQGLITSAAYGYGQNQQYGGWAKNIYSNDGIIEGNGSGIDGNWNLHRFQRDSNGIASFAVWGSNMNKSYSQSGFEGLGIHYGPIYSVNGSNYFSDCDIAEIIIYDRSLNPGEASKVESYLANKYNLASNLYVPILATSNQFAVTAQPLPSTISTLSSITNLKYWFDPSQISYVIHPYKVSTASANTSSISYISSLDCWFDASGASNFSTFGSSIAIWYDKGSNQRHIVQSTIGRQPLFVSSQNLVAFNQNGGANQFMRFTTSPGIVSVDYTIFMVEQRQTSGNDYFFGGRDTGTNQQFYMGYSGNTFIAGNYNTAMGVQLENYPVRASNEPYRIFSIQYSSNLQYMRIFANGIMCASNAINGTNELYTWNNAYLGLYYTGGTGCNYSYGNMKEFMFYSRSLTDAERTNVEGYLASKWMLTSSLTSATLVSTMKNLTNLGGDLLVTNGSYYNMPLLTTSATLGNKNVLRFDPSRAMYQVGFNIYPTEYTMFTLSRQITYAPGITSNQRQLNNTYYLFQGLVTGAIYGYGSGPNGWVNNYFTNDGSVEVFGTSMNSNWNLHRFQRASNGMTSLYYFGSNVNKGYTQSGFEGLGINYGSSGGPYSDCEVSEILIYDRNLTPGECDNVEKYLVNKYYLSTSYNSISTVVVNISSLSSITGLKLWFDPTQMSFTQNHPYSVSTVGKSFSPSSISTLDTWYDASVSTSFSTFGSSIVRWNDLGFYKHNLYQSTLSRSPKYFSSGTVASNYVYFDGYNFFMRMSTTSGIINSDYSVFVVEQRNLGNYNFFIGGSNTNSYQNFAMGYNGANAVCDIGNYSMYTGIDAFIDYGNRNVEPYRIWCLQYSANLQYRSLYLNGLLVNSAGFSQDLVDWLYPMVGMMWWGNCNFYGGKINEIQFYTSALDTSTRQTIEGYLATKWNLQQNLISNTYVTALKNMTNLPGDMVSGSPPILISSFLLGGKNVMRFTTSNNLYLSYTDYYKEFTLIYMARHVGSNPNNSRAILQGQNVASYFGYQTNVKNYFYLDGNIEVNGAPTNSNWDLWTFTKTLDGIASIAYFGSNINTNYTQSGFEGMAINTGNDNNNVSDCEVGEILLYNKVLGPNERSKVESYLANKYNLTSNLYQPNTIVPEIQLVNRISSLSNIPDLKYWYDPTQIPIISHPYSFSSPGTNLSSIKGLDCWFDASGVSNFSTFGSSIAIWYDKGPNRRDLTQSTIGKQPTLISSTSNLVKFDGQTQFLNFSTTPGVVGSDYSIFIIEQVQSNASDRVFMNMMLGGTNTQRNYRNLYLGYCNAYNGSPMYVVSGCTNWNGQYSVGYLTSVVPSMTRPMYEPYRIWSLQYSSNAKVVKMYINGDLYTLNTQFSNDIQGWDNASMGLFYDGNNYYYNPNTGGYYSLSNFYNGNIRELLIYSNYLPDSQRQQIEGYLAWKWSVQSNLNSKAIVSTFRDLAGTNNHFVPYYGYLCNYPILTTNPTLGGKQVLRFNSNIMIYQCNTLYYENEYTLFTLSRHIGTSNSRYIFLGTNPVLGMQYNNPGAIYGYGNGPNGWSKNYFTADGNVETLGTNVDSNWNLHRFQCDLNGNGSIANFGQVINKAFLQSGFEGLGINFGWANDGTNGYRTNVIPYYISDCEVSEIIFYNRALTSSECIQVEQYIANKYNLGAQYTALSTSAFITTVPTLNTISSLSDITGLKLWFDPSQLNFLPQHPYRFSTVASNFSPSSISSLDGWFDASISTNFSMTDSNVIWYDLGSNKKHLYQSTVTNSPTFISSLILSSNSVNFNANYQQYMNFLPNAIPGIIRNDYTIFVLEQRQPNYNYWNPLIGGSNRNGYGNFTMAYAGTSNFHTDLYTPDYQTSYDSYVVHEASNTRSNDEPFRIWCVQYSYPLNIRNMFMNGTLMATTTMTQELLSWVSSGVGMWNDTFYTGNMKEVMFYTSYLEDSKRQIIEGYLATKWGIQSNLMSNGTYISTLKNLTGLPTDMINTSGQIFQMPTLCNNSTLGNKNVLRFNTQYSHYMNLAAINQTSPIQYLVYPSEFTLFYLSRHIGQGCNSRYIMQGQTMTAYYGYGYGINGWCKSYFYNDGSIDTNGLYNDSNWNLYSFTKQSNGMASFRYFGSNGKIGYANSGFEGMAINTGNDPNNTSDCEVSEILLYDRALTATETTRVEQYIANKYGLSTIYTQFSTINYASSIMKTISSLSTIPNLKLWFDPSQINYLQHPYRYSTVASSFSPSTISSMDCWFDASISTNFSTNGSTVSAWFDLGSNRRHLVQPNPTCQPFFISSQTTASNSIYFNGQNQYMSFISTPNISNTDYTIMIVEQRRAQYAWYFLGGSNNNTYQNIQWGYNSPTNCYFWQYNGAGMQINIENYSDSGNRGTEPFRIWSMTYSSNLRSLLMHVNGYLVANYFPWSNDMTDWVSSGIAHYNGQFYTGNIKELVFFSNALPESSRQIMEGYFANKWGIQGNLMSNTPISSLTNLTGLPANLLNNTGQYVNMPFLSTSALLGGKNVIRFDVTKSLYLDYINPYPSYTYTNFLQSVSYPNEFSLFYIARHVHSNTTNSRLIMQGNNYRGNNVTAYYGYNTSQRKGIFVLDGYTIEGNGFPANCNWDLWSFTKNSNGMASIYYFGSNINTYYSASGFDGMAFNTGNDTNNISDCEVGEILLYDRELMPSERSQVEAYIGNKYNMTSNLYNINFNAPQSTLTKIISSLSTISDLKFWYDPTQLPIVRHPYNFTKPTVNPSTFSGLDCWFDSSGASNFSLLTLSSVAIWYDKGSNARHLIQTSPTSYPVYNSSTNTVNLSNNQYMYFTTSPAIANSDFTVFVVEQRQSNINNYTGNYSFFLAGSNDYGPGTNSNFYMGYSNVYQYYNYANLNINYAAVGFYNNNDMTQPISNISPRLSDEPYRIWSFTYGSNAKIRKLYVNGFLYGYNSNYTSGDVAFWSNASLGIFNCNNGSIYYYTGNVKEMIFYSNYMDDSSRQQIEGYLAWKWGLQSNLNSNTPVSTLQNLAGRSCDLIPYSGALCNYPSLVVNPVLGQQVLRFNCNTQFYQSNAMIYWNEYTFFTLTRQLVGNAPTAGGCNNGANCNIRNFIYGLNQGLFGYGSGYNGYAKNIFNADGTVENYGTPPDSNWDLFRFRRDSNGQGSLNYFGSNVNKGYLQSGFEGFGINYSYNQCNFTQGYYSDGEVAEIIFYNRALTSNECTQVENYIANKYNLSQRLIQYSSPTYYLSTNASLSTIPNLKLWFDPSKMSTLQHVYRYSTVGSNFSPSSISSLDAWYDASISTNFTLNGYSNVSQWRDSTGRGRTLTQVTSGNQPFFTPGVSSISSSVYFNNSQFLRFTNIPNILSNNYTIFIVEQRQTSNGNNYFIGGSNTNTYGNLFMGYNASNYAYVDLYNYGLGATIENYVTSNTRFTEPWRIWSLTYSSNSTQRNLYINGHLIVNQFMYQDLLSWTGASIGLYWQGGSYYYTGYMKEILFFSNALDTSTRQLIEGYLATKWNLQCNLMSNTPVSTLKNLTGLGVDMINTSGQLFNMPTLTSSALLGGKNVLRFIGSNTQTLFLGYLNSNSSNLPTIYPTYSLIYPNQYSLFYIARHLGCNTTYSRLILQGQTQTAYYGYNGSQTKNIFYNDGWIEVNGVNANSNWDLWSFTRSNDGTAAIYYFGSNINIGYATSGFEGLGINTPDTGSVSDCEVGEILVYDRYLGASERKTVETYLATKYNMTSNLQTQSINYSLSLNAAPAAAPSTLSSITNLKFWFDPGQLPILQHPYKYSSIIGISPSTISSLDCWLDASGANNFVLATSNVTKWIDKTGRGRDLIQTTTANQPIFSTNTQEVVFNGSKFMTFSTIPGVVNSDYTFFILEKRQSNTSPNYFIGGSNTNTYSNLYMGYNTTSNFYFDTYNNGTQLTIDTYTNVANEPYRLWTMAYSSNLNTRCMYLNGINYMTVQTSNDLLSWNGASVGRFWNGGTYYYTGNIHEIIIYNSFLDDRTRTFVEGYLARKWGIQSNLTTFTPVSTLRNLTGVASDFTAQYASPCQLSNQPILNYNTDLKYNVMSFTSMNPVRNMQLCNNLVYANEYTIFTISRYTPGCNRTIFQSITAPNTLYGYGYNSSSNNWAKNYFLNDGTVEIYGNPSNTQWDFHTFHRDSNGLATLFYYGSNFNSGYTQSGFEGLSINYGSYDTSCNSASECEVGEILIYDRALVPTERKAVENYLTTKYGMTALYNFYTQNQYYNTISTISSISTLQVWLDAGQIVASNTASISTVMNMTGLGGGLFSNSNASQSSYPTLITNFQNGNSVLDFTNNQQLWFSPPRIWESVSMFSITRQTGGTNKRVLQGTTGDVGYGYNSGKKASYYMEQWQFQNPQVSDTNWDMNNFTRTSNGFLSTVTWNGSTMQITNPSTFLGLEGIGINYCNNSESSACQVGEILVYDRPLLYPSESRAVETYLAKKWGIQRYLPVLHPGFLYQLSAYSGYKVQASSISTLCLWLDSSYTSTITTNPTGTNLIRWSDRSGTIDSISQATALYQPNYTTVLGPNFCNSQYLNIGQISTFVVASTFSMLFLERRQSTNTCNMILGGANATTNNNLQVGYYNTSSFGFSFYNNDVTVQVSSFSNTQIEPPRIWSMTYDRSNKYLFMNGGVVSSVQTTTQDLLSYTAPTIGSNGATQTAYNGYLMEMLVYSPALSTPALRAAEGYLAWKWGINSFLAPSHPWSSSEPIIVGAAYKPGLWAKFYTNTGSPPDSNGPPGNTAGTSGSSWGTPIVGTFTSGPTGTLGSNTPGPTNKIDYGVDGGYQPQNNANYQAIYSGFFYSAVGGTIQFQMLTDDGMRVDYDNQNVILAWQQQGTTGYSSAVLPLVAGKYTPIMIRWYDSGGGGRSVLNFNINNAGFVQDGTGYYFYGTSNITQL